MQTQYQGKVIEVDDVEVLSEKENWNEYQLADGKLLRIKTTLVRVQRAKTERTQDGVPVYLVRTNQIVDAK